MATLTERVWNANQSWNYEHVFAIDADEGGDRYRTTIRRNAYDKQSFGKVERWDGTQWQEVLRRSIGELQCAAISYVRRSIVASDFSADAFAMECDALDITGRA